MRRRMEADNVKNAGMKMSLMMGTTMSFCLSLVGNLASGKFTLPGFLLSFLVSLIISLLIGFLVPMGKVTASLDARLGLQRGKLSTRCFEALVSDLIYSPIITLVMVFMAWRRATAQGAQIPFLPMFLRSLIISLAVGFVLAFLLTPLYMKIAMKGQRK